MHPVFFQIGSLVVPTYGVVAASGILMALLLAQFTASRTGLAPRHAWNMLILATFASLVVSRLLLIVMNLADLRRHPTWLLAVAMVHHPLLSAAGILGASVAVLFYIGWAKLPPLLATDTIAAPLAVGMAAEQLASLMAGSDFGSETSLPWAVTYTSPLAARWSGTPIGVPLHPVQAYAALAALVVATLTLTLLCLPRLSRNQRRGEITGIWLLATGALLFLTELFRDWEGRGVVAHGIVDTPQLVALGMVLCGGLLLTDWSARRLTA